MQKNICKKGVNINSKSVINTKCVINIKSILNDYKKCDNSNSE